MLEALHLMSAGCTLPGINKMNGSCTRAMFFRDPITDDVATLAPGRAIEHMHEMATRGLDALTPLRRIDAERAQTLAEMRQGARQIIHAARKTRAGRRFATLAEDDSDNRRQLYDELDTLEQALHEQRWGYQRL